MAGLGRPQKRGRRPAGCRLQVSLRVSRYIGQRVRCPVGLRQILSHVLS
jgi:hypothetical protein